MNQEAELFYAQLGNATAMREALNDVISIADREFNAFRETAAMKEMRDKCNAALAAPPRNCDVGTAEEQSKRMKIYCKAHGIDESECYRCESCALLRIDRCELAWSQLPYEAEEGDKESPND